MNYLRFLLTYPNFIAARVRSDQELAVDAAAVAHAIRVNPDRQEAYRLTVVRDWIAQARILRLWGLDAPSDS